MFIFLKSEGKGMKKFEVLEEEATADVAYKAYGESLEEMYSNAALGLFSLITDIKSVDVKQVDLITVEAEDKEALLLDFLNELIYRWDVEKILFSDFSCEISKEGEGLVLKAECKGETFDGERHKVKTEIKAITYFGMKVEKKDGIWETIITPDV